MLFLAETLTRFAKKHPKLVCKPGLRKSRAGWEQTSRYHRRNRTCINFFIFIFFFFKVDVWTRFVNTKDTRGSAVRRKKRWASHQGHQYRLETPPNVYEQFIPSKMDSRLSARRLLLLFSHSMRREGSECALGHATFDWNVTKEQLLVWRYSGLSEGAVG